MSNPQKSILHAIVGPTGAGKTAVGIAVARRLGAEIVSADSRQIYRYMDIGTAKPTPAEQQAVRHHLIDIVYPDQPFSAGEYARQAQRCIQALLDSGVLPLIVGGAGLYIRALMGGLFTAPAIPDTVRQRVRARARTLDSPSLHEELRSVDPETAARLHPNDRQRIVRALEVLEATGVSLTRWQRTAEPHTPRFSLRLIGLERERDDLYARINIRVERMMEAGWVEEVRRLLDRGYTAQTCALRTFGYAEIIAHLQSALSYDEAVEQIKRRTRRYAKRQMTWFRQAEGIEWIKVEPDTVLERIGEELAGRIRRNKE